MGRAKSTYCERIPGHQSRLRLELKAGTIHQVVGPAVVKHDLPRGLLKRYQGLLKYFDFLRLHYRGCIKQGLSSWTLIGGKRIDFRFSSLWTLWYRSSSMVSFTLQSLESDATSRWLTGYWRSAVELLDYACATGVTFSFNFIRCQTFL